MHQRCMHPVNEKRFDISLSGRVGFAHGVTSRSFYDRSAGKAIPKHHKKYQRDSMTFKLSTPSAMKVHGTFTALALTTFCAIDWALPASPVYPAAAD